MRIVATLAACALSTVFAQGAADFRGRASIDVPGSGPIYRVALPEGVYRDARADLADVRIFNARGEMVPIALASEPAATREALPPVELAAFPLTSLEPASIASQVSVRLRDGTLVSVDGQGVRAPPDRRAAGYILDANAIKEPIRELDIDWETLPQRETIRVRIEGSDDLRTWRAMSATVPLLRIDQGGRRLEQSRVPLEGSTAKYLRIDVVDAPFTLRSARAYFADRSRPPDLVAKRVSGKPGSKPGEVVYDLEGRLPVEAVRVIPADANSVIAAALFVRDAAEGNPSWVAEATFYRLKRDGSEIESPPAHLRRRASRYWVVRTDPDKGGYGSALPQLEVQWRPAQVVFVARGEPPYTLAFGRSDAKSALLPVASLIPGYESHAESRLPLAAVGAVTRGAMPQDAYPAWLQDVPPRKLALWAVLVGAVALLGFMAWRLSRAR